MKTKISKAKLISGALAGLMILSLGSTSFAANTKSDKTSTGNDSKPGIVRQNIDISTKLAELVTAGTITQAQADKIVAYLKNLKEEKKTESKDTAKAQRKDILSGLVEDGTLTQEQADLVKEAIMPGKGHGNGMGRGNENGKSDTGKTKLTDEQLQAKFEERAAKQKETITTALAAAVSNGTITQAKSDELLAYYEKQEAARQEKMANKEKDTDKTAEGDIQKGKACGMFSGAVDEEIITEDQAEAIQEIMRENQESANTEATAAELTKLVTAGTITQAQSDKVTAAIAQEKANRQAEQEKIAAMTDTEREAYFKDNKSEKPVNALDALVSDGTLTQEQADAIMDALRDVNGMGGPGFGHGGPGMPCPEETTDSSAE